jgi:hypothetical protein
MSGTFDPEPIETSGGVTEESSAVGIVSLPKQLPASCGDGNPFGWRQKKVIICQWLVSDT